MTTTPTPACFFTKPHDNGLEFFNHKSDEKAAGYSLIVLLDGSRATLMSLLIGKSFQGQGLGRILLEQAIKSAAESSWKTLELSSSGRRRHQVI